MENSSLEVDIWYCTFGHTLAINLIFVKSVAKIFVLRENYLFIKEHIQEKSHINVKYVASISLILEPSLSTGEFMYNDSYLLAVTAGFRTN